MIVSKRILFKGLAHSANEEKTDTLFQSKIALATVSLAAIAMPTMFIAMAITG